jgi:hypothetical protein
MQTSCSEKRRSRLWDFLLRAGRRSSPFGAVVMSIAILTANPHAAHANVDVCQAAIEKAGATLRAATAKALANCADVIAKESARGGKGNLVRAADKCEASLATVFDRAGANPGKSSIAKFQTAIDRLFPKTCIGADLRALGHLASGAGGTAPPAPGGSPAVQDWAKTWLAVANVKTAVVQQLLHERDFFNRLGEAMAAANDCTTSQVRPNLCQFDVQCRSHACQLTAASNASLAYPSGEVGTVPVSGRFILDVCPMKGFGFGLGEEGDFVILMGGPRRAIDPVNIGDGVVCVDQISAEGWCDCTGLGVPPNAAFCQDHIEANGDGCLGSETGSVPAPEEPCFCDDGSGIPGARCSPTLDPCPNGSVCGIKASGGVCHAGTQNGPLKTIRWGASLPGDCLLLETLQFKTLPSAALFGPDGQPCTADDTVGPSAPMPVPLTTGISAATVVDAVVTQGTCDGGKTHCIENANCFDGTCVGAATTNTSSPVVAGQRLDSCATLESGGLRGLKLVGAFPTVDGGGGGLGDLAVSFEVNCE